MHIATSCGTFVLRTCYLKIVPPESIDIDTTFNSEEQQNDIIDASFAFIAEQHAVQYLARSEHSRLLLERKLAKKKLSQCAIEQALDYLEQKNYLNNKRFAESWLRNRTITKTEGPTRLRGELAKRGVNRETINVVLEDFFAENNVDELFKKAAEKQIRLGKSGKKLQQALLRQGFDWKLIKTLVSTSEES